MECSLNGDVEHQYTKVGGSGVDCMFPLSAVIKSEKFSGTRSAS